MTILAIDGGGTKTSFLLTDLHGNEIWRAEAGPSNLSTLSAAQVAARLGGVFAQMPAAPESVCAGFAGAGRTETAALYESMIQRLAPQALVHVCTDAEIAYAGALGFDPGILVIAGTGSIAVGRDRHGQLHRAGGYGPVFGDEGSGFWIGREAIRTALAMYDAGSDNGFQESVASRLGLTSIDGVVEAWRTSRLIVPHVAALFELVVNTYPAEPARSILTSAASQLRQLADRVAARGADLSRVSYAGSVASHPVIRELTRLSFLPPKAGPLAGARLIARQKLDSGG